MKVFFTGATGVIGHAAVPDLTAAGHEVTAVARTAADHSWLKEVGAAPVAVDLFDRSAVADAVVGAEAVVHMATAIPAQAKMAKRASWDMNDRLRTDTASHLVDAALSSGVETFIQQSISLVYADGGASWLGEDAEIATVWSVLDSALDAERHTLRFSESGGRGVVLRLSSLYGPGRASSEYIASVAARKQPIVGKGDNYVSHLHVADAAAAIVVALEAPAGVYNVTDDMPVSKRQELDALAGAIGAKAPRQVPRWLAKVTVGPATNILTVSHRVSNDHFKDTTGWEPRFPSVLDGWADAITDPARIR